MLTRYDLQDWDSVTIDPKELGLNPLPNGVTIYKEVVALPAGYDLLSPASASSVARGAPVAPAVVPTAVSAPVQVPTTPVASAPAAAPAPTKIQYNVSWWMIQN